MTGFHAGRFNPDKLEQRDADALAKTITRSCSVLCSSDLDCCVEKHSRSKAAKIKPPKTKSRRIN